MLYTTYIVLLITALNLAWALIGAVALALFCAHERRRSSRHAARGRLRRFSAVAIVVLSLFPCVSASDDILGLAYLNLGPKSQGVPGNFAPENSKSSPSVHFAHVLQALENLRISSVYALFITLSFFGLIFLSHRQSHIRQLPCIVGRAPPAF